MVPPAEESGAEQLEERAPMISTWSKELGMLTELTHYRAPRNSYYGDLGTKQPHCYRFHTLRQCREKWTSHYGEQDTEGWGEDTIGITLTMFCPQWFPKP